MYLDYLDKIPRTIGDTRILIIKYLNDELKRIGCEKVAPSHGEILYNLIVNGEMTMTELSNAITKDRSTVTALVSKLIKRGMVEYIPNPDDMRSKKVGLTDKGLDIETNLVNISSNMNEILWKNISDDEKEIFIKVLLKIKSNFTNIE